jgi:hypothetical protein
MMIKCANPSCSRPFRYLHEGKLFRLDSSPPNGGGSFQHGEWFWLCNPCTSKVTLRVEGGDVIAKPWPCGPEPLLGGERNLCLRQAS